MGSLYLHASGASGAGVEQAEQLRADGGEPYAYSYAPTHTAATLATEYASLGAGEEDTEADVAVSGRILTRRNFGKLAFFTLQAHQFSPSH
eukprot:6189768-Pleurochrysis_carterae.AAC.2